MLWHNKSVNTKASATSWTAACDPGGRWRMVEQIVSKVSHVQGKWDEVILALMVRMLFVVPEYGDEKFWMTRNLPSLLGLETMEMGEVWYGPRMSSICCCENGPSYLLVVNSWLTDFWNMSLNSEVLSLLEGVKVVVMYLMPALMPCCILVGMCLYLLSRLLDSRVVCHLRVRYGVLVLNLGLGKATSLGSMVIASASRALVLGEMWRQVAGSGEIPVETESVAWGSHSEFGTLVTFLGEGWGMVAHLVSSAQTNGSDVVTAVRQWNGLDFPEKGIRLEMSNSISTRSEHIYMCAQFMKISSSFITFPLHLCVPRESSA